MKSSVTIYSIAALVALICVSIGIYYLIPGVTHLVFFEDPQGQHIKYTVAFFAVAIVVLLGAALRLTPASAPVQQIE